jgi:primosomal protein N' (replication factor Y)
MAPFFLSVAVPAPLPKVFDYLPEPNVSMSHYQAGLRVKVPFGGRVMMGVIVDIHQAPQISPTKLKSIQELVDSKPLLDTVLFRLGHWLSEYYHQPLGESISQLWPVLLRKGQPAEPTSELAWRVSSAVPVASKSEFSREFKRAPRQQALWEVLSDQDTYPQKDLVAQGFTPAVMKGLAEKGYIESISLPSFRPIDGQAIDAKKTLNDEQGEAVAQLLDQQGFVPSLLEGVTGSGKTEVYLQAIAPHIEKGKQVLILVPEIGLTPQTVERFSNRFDADILLLHSHLTDRERLDAWLLARGHQSGERAQIIIGTRSAVYTPMPNLACIIIDEEHDASFKQQDGVRYHGRDVAVMRGKLQNVPVILGSATPSLDSLHNALAGKYRHIRLTQRAGQAKPPKLHIYDLKKQPQNHGLADELLPEIRNTLNAGQQVLLFINRRGYAPTLYCPDCGWVADCKRCDAKMTLHQKPPHLHCHHCDSKQALPQHCPECFSRDIHPLGVGTERLEQHLLHNFSDVPVVRIDRDSTQNKNSFNKLLEPVHAGEPCILVGTQMLAKGHHFPKVTLVIVINGDSGFFSADFRAMEKSAQLLLQVAGRAGREKEQGRAIIQTEFSDHPMLHLLTDENYHSLALAILQERHQQHLPPYGFQGLVRADSTQRQEAEHFLHLVKQHFQQYIQEQSLQGLHMIGPLSAPMELRAGRFRSQLWINCPNRKLLHHVLEHCIKGVYEFKGFHRVRWSLDVDPTDNL